MTILGIDNGYGYTKDSSLNIFRSTYNTEEPLSLHNSYELRVDGKSYWVGSGIGTVELNKTGSLVNRLGTLTCLGLNADNEFCLVVGLPLNQFNQDKDVMKKSVLSYNNSCISLKGVSKTVKIHEVAVYPQSVATLYSSNITDDVIIVDVGFRTVDIVLVQFQYNKPNIVMTDTYYCGMFSLYDAVSNAINKRFRITSSALEMEHVLYRGLFIDGVKQDLSFLSAVLSQYYEDLFNQLLLKYPVRSTNMLLTGGGAHFVHKAFCKRFPNTIIHKNNQFSNAQGYYQIGLRLFT